MNITLPILKHTEETEKLESLGIDFDDDKFEIENITFYKIYAISPIGNFCAIHTNGTEYVCTHSYEEVWDKLKKYESTI